MTTSAVYAEAILEARKLRELAEANAKNALIEAITPRVRDMIERSLLGEAVADLDEEILAGAADDLAGSELASADQPEEVLPGLPAVEPKSSGPTGTVPPTGTDGPLEAPILTDVAGDRRQPPGLSAGDAALRVTEARRKVDLARDLLGSKVSLTAEGRRVASKVLKRASSEVRTLEEDVIRIVGSDPGSVRAAWVSDVKRMRGEIDKMGSKRNLRESQDEMYEADDAETTPLDLAGSDDGEMDGEASLAPIDDLEAEASGDGDVQIPADLAQDLLAALEAELGDETSGDDVDGEGDLPAMADAEVEGDDLELDDDEVVEIDEGMLRREIARMRSNRTLSEERKKKSAGKEPKGSCPDPMASSFGGGKVERELFVDSDDDDLNVNEVKRLRDQVRSEGRKNRALRKQVTGLQEVSQKLQSQLERMNLFNAKLLYVNKLMTNEGITAKQRQVVVESLDKAKTIREVKLLYKTLSEGLARRSPSKGPATIAESASRRSSSASRPAQSGAASGGAGDRQLDRWALLAGLGRDEK